MLAGEAGRVARLGGIGPGSLLHERAAPLAVAALLAIAGGACSKDATGPQAPSVVLELFAGDGQFGARNAALAEPLRVRARNSRSDDVEEGIEVEWRVVEGSGASLSTNRSLTDSAGVASVRLTLGADTGVYRVEASAPRLVGGPVVFEARAVLTPEITGISPAPATAGGTVTIAGRNFSGTASSNLVLFGGFRGSVLAASPEELTVVVPACVPTRTVSVTVQLGSVASPPTSLAVTGGEVAPLELAAGQGTTLDGPEDLACFALRASAGGSYLLVPQNAVELPGAAMPFHLAGLLAPAPPSGPPAAAAPAAEPRPGGTTTPALEWESRIRAWERAIRPSDVVRPAPRAPGAVDMAPPQPGDRREFNVINRENEFEKVTAEVKYVSRRAIIYQDLKAPSGGLSASDFEAFGRLFDDPIYDEVAGTFGTPSDIDGNGSIIILFTPVVNAMTPRNETGGFIAGFAFAWDLTNGSGSNRAEIFYSLVPDPTGQYSRERSVATILRVVPPVLAHEFQHLIHFNQRRLVRGASSDDVLWLSEGLAHMAEDVVGEVLLARGDSATAVNFLSSNLARAGEFLLDPGAVGLITETPPGSIEERGAAWLLLKYLAGHYGGRTLLADLTQTTRTGAANVVAATGQPWRTLFGEWAVAVWADGAPEFDGVPLDPRYTIPDLDLRRSFSRVGFPLLPRTLAFADLRQTGSLLSGGVDYVMLQASSTSQGALSLTFQGAFGGPFSGQVAPQISVLRVR